MHINLHFNLMRSLRMLPAALFFLCPAAWSQGQNMLDDVRRHFEWGDYDTIIAIVEPMVSASADTIDSTVAAEYRKYLGVAYLAKDRVNDARGQFTIACQLNPDVKLEREFVSQAIYDVFQNALAEYRRRRQEAARADSLIRAKEAQLEERTRNLVAVNKQLRRSIRVNLASGFSLVGMAAVSATAFAYEYRITRNSWLDLKAAADIGDLAKRQGLVDKVSTGNMLLSVAATSGVACAGAAAYFFWNAVQRKREAGRQLPEINLVPGGNGAALVFDF
jgi:hypothetical protein